MALTCLYETSGKDVMECGCRKCALRIKLSKRIYKPNGKKTLAELRLDRELDAVWEREKDA
jgi:hypothetical protein